jgi:hypothetical protein
VPRQIVTAFSGQQCIPILFLMRHSLELQLKMILALLDELDGVSPKKRGEHLLSLYWGEVQRRAARHFRDDELKKYLSPEFEYITEQLRPLTDIDDRGTTFRYEDHDQAMPSLDIDVFADSSAEVFQTLDYLVDALGTFCDHKAGRI